MDFVENESKKSLYPIFGCLIRFGLTASSNRSDEFSSENPRKTKQIVQSRQLVPSLLQHSGAPNARRHLFSTNDRRSGDGSPTETDLCETNNLCQKYFIKGHFSADCSRSRVCRVPGCGQRHSSWLHSAIVTDGGNDQSTSTNKTSTSIDQSTGNELNADQRCPTAQALANKNTQAEHGSIADSACYCLRSWWNVQHEHICSS